MSTPEVSYAANMKRVNDLAQEIQTSDDVQEIMAKYEAAVTLLRECAGVIERARGQLAVMPLPDIAPAS